MTNLCCNWMMGMLVFLAFAGADSSAIHGASGTIVLSTAGAASSAGGAPLALVQWTNSSGGYFDVTSNWSTGFAPGINDSASFAMNDIYSVDWDSITGDIVNDDLFVTGGEVTLRSLGSGGGGPVYDYELNDAVTVGAGAFLKIGDGIDGHNLFVGGDLLVDDANMKVSRLGSLTVDGQTDIGSSATASGFLNLQDASFDATGVICLGIGSNAKGRIVAASETSANTTNVDVGCSPTGIGRLEIVGENTVWNSTTELDIGNNGSGIMEIRLGAVVNSQISAIGWQPGGSGQVTVKHAGSQWNIASQLLLGGNANTTGTLLVQESGSVFVGNGGVLADIFISPASNLVGSEVIVEDPGSLLSSTRHIFVGGFSTQGTLTIQNNANAIANDTIEIRPAGVVNVAGSGTPALTADEIENNGLMSLSASGPDIFADVSNNGTIESIDGAASWFYHELRNNGIEVHTELGSETRCFSLLAGSGSFTGSGQVVIDNGVVEPGAGRGQVIAGTILFEGDLNFTNAAIALFELGETESDRIVIEGDLTINNGFLMLYYLDAYVPIVGEEFVVVELGGTRTGQFNGLPEGALVSTFGGVNQWLTYSGGDGNDIVVTTIFPGVLLGDVNLDGFVSLLDIAPFVNRLTTGTYQAEADINQDGVVSLLDVAPFVSLLTGS